MKLISALHFSLHMHFQDGSLFFSTHLLAFWRLFFFSFFFFFTLVGPIRHFDINPETSTTEEQTKIFSVLDFTGDVCKTLGSRIRAAVAAEKFDNFHKHSARIIRGSIFGVTSSGKIGDRFAFGGNGLIVTNVDVQVGNYVYCV